MKHGVIQRIRDRLIAKAILEPCEHVIARLHRVESLMLTGMSDQEARTSVSSDWAKGIRRWKPIDLSIDQARKVNPELAREMEAGAQEMKRAQRKSAGPLEETPTSLTVHPEPQVEDSEATSETQPPKTGPKRIKNGRLAGTLRHINKLGGACSAAELSRALMVSHASAYQRMSNVKRAGLVDDAGDYKWKVNARGEALPLSVSNK